MKHSVKLRIALTFILLMALTLLAVGLVHWGFLGRYYSAKKQETLMESWEMANREEVTEISNSFLNYCSGNSLSFAITDQNMNCIVSNSQDGDGMASRLLGNLLSKEKNNTKILKEAEYYQVIQIHDRFMKCDYLELWGVLDSNNYYIVLCPVDSISESVALSNQFYFYIGTIMMVISAIVIWMLTSRITYPLQELTGLSKRMAGLDFNARYTSGGEDEIGELGRNFNRMSEKLEATISELKSANLQLQRDIEEKTQAEEMRKVFLSDVSHELKTPIALIQGYAEGLKDNISDDPENMEFYCDVIMDESAKMNALVQKLKNLNELEFGLDQLQMDYFDLSELISGVLQYSQILIEQKQAAVSFRQQDQPIFVWGDEFKIEEVVTNYLTNALNHLDGDRIVEISCAEQNGIVTTTVFNTGEPIPEESLNKLWIKFYKVDQARTRAYGGSGIGLSIVKAIMDAHQQSCNVRNFENGVAFSFTLESKC